MKKFDFSARFVKHSKYFDCKVALIRRDDRLKICFVPCVYKNIREGLKTSEKNSVFHKFLKQSWKDAREIKRETTLILKKGDKPDWELIKRFYHHISLDGCQKKEDFFKYLKEKFQQFNEGEKR